MFHSPTPIMSDITININGGNNQILPNATEAVQSFYGDQFEPNEVTSSAPQVTPTPEPDKLALYINKECLDTYLAQIASCRTAAEVAKVVITMYEHEPKLSKEDIVKERFISLLLPHASHLSKGTSISNLRTNINAALMALPKQSRIQK